ncbi:hypothetical protein C8R46DRAFT_891061 [Mycena filopes]|nr:hypothetical protein C8R46DRAFT_891061 [Mycena filopes]
MSGSVGPLHPEHHPKYYFADGSAIFQVRHPGPLYKLHYSVLGSRSSFFETLFSLPRGPNVDQAVRMEGTNDSNPIQLPVTVNQFDFDNLLCYIYVGSTNHPQTDDFHVSILKLSTFFEIEDGIAFAIRYFTLKGAEFHPALQFELGRLYRIDEWIAPAFRRLMELPITSLTIEHMQQIGTVGYFYLVQTKAEVEAHRKMFAFNTPKAINDPQCRTVVKCQISWAVEWGQSVQRLIHHPDAPLSLIDLMKLLKETEIDNLCEGCRKRTVTWVWGTGLVTKEDNFIEVAAEALTALQTDKPIRAHGVQGPSSDPPTDDQT